MDNNMSGGIQSLIPKKNIPLVPDNQSMDKSDEALEKQISDKVDSLLNPNATNQTEIVEQPLEPEKQENYQKPIISHSPEKLEHIFSIEIEKIKPNPQQPRRYFSEESIDELAESIKEYGVLEPLIVERLENVNEYGSQVEYQLIAGERRLMASKKLGFKTVPAVIKNFSTEQRRLEVALIENIQREDLSIIAKAKAFAKLMSNFGLSQKEVAERLGKSREVVANSLRLLQLPYEAQKALDEAKINEGHARALLLINNPQKRLALLGEILSKNLSGREAEIISKRMMGMEETTINHASKKFNFSSEAGDLEMKEKLENVFQTPVNIRKRGKEGEIAIKFYSEEEMNKIIEWMLKIKDQAV